MGAIVAFHKHFSKEILPRQDMEGFVFHWEKTGADVTQNLTKSLPEPSAGEGILSGGGLLSHFLQRLHACYDGISYIIVSTTIVHRTVTTKVHLAAMPLQSLDCKPDSIDSQLIGICDIGILKSHTHRFAQKFAVHLLIPGSAQPMQLTFHILSIVPSQS